MNVNLKKLKEKWMNYMWADPQDVFTTYRPKVVFKTRYGDVQSPFPTDSFDTSKFYRRVKVSELL